ncbi:hypothetical protein [Tepidibacter thalassicus]|uniref:Uncharacterized protein n=1 Tax=Tepidibacter thalassicus DSM 15285 TaxID=1123350 RepID=A0A1M5SUU2_9FIRM|nr:hypothetical protein [Tepidibacter thalassicus]SHH42028.1 hypothetical protein SAMN02744040_01908 [Tepidibacter thalassicus DSM 15285]
MIFIKLIVSFIILLTLLTTTFLEILAYFKKKHLCSKLNHYFWYSAIIFIFSIFLDEIELYVSNIVCIVFLSILGIISIYIINKDLKIYTEKA